MVEEVVVVVVVVVVVAVVVVVECVVLVGVLSEAVECWIRTPIPHMLSARSSFQVARHATSTMRE